MNAWQFLISLNSVCHFMSKERQGKASNSELRRWCQNQAVIINGKRVKWDEEIEFPITKMILFPKSPITLF